MRSDTPLCVLTIIINDDWAIRCMRQILMSVILSDWNALRGAERTAPGLRNDVKEVQPTCGAEGYLKDTSAIQPVQKQK